MRIEGYIEHPAYKITILKMNNRYSIKFESGGLEQTYKIRVGEYITSLSEVQELVDENFMKGVDETFKIMNRNRQNALEKKILNNENPFPNII